MRTSNKLIIIALGIVALGFTSFLIAAKSSMGKSNFEYIKGDGNISTRNLGTLDAKLLELGQDYQYTLDPHSSDIIVEGDKNTIDLILDLQEGGKELNTRNLHGYDKNVEPSRPYKFTIGIKGKPSIAINLSNDAKLNNADTLDLSSLRLNIYNSAKAKINSNTEKMFVRLGQSSTLDLKGSCEILQMDAQNNAICDATSFTSNHWIIDLSNNARATIVTENEIDGTLTNSSKLITNASASTDGIAVYNSARIENL